jgi:hypothetical protein
MRKLVAWPLALALTVGVAGSAIAQKAAGAGPTAVTEEILFARGGSIWRAPRADPKAAVEAISLGSTAGAPLRIDVSDNGAIALIHLRDGADGQRAVWADLRAAPTAARPLDCAGPAVLDPAGRCVICANGTGGIALYRLGKATRRFNRDIAPTHLSFLRSAPRELVVSDANGLWAVPLARPAARRQLAPHRPDEELLIAPGGERAVGVYAETNRAGRAVTATYVFRLDGEGVRRRLIQDATPVAWSADGVWILIQEGNRACLTRAIGGQYKCWRRFEAVAIAPDGREVILRKHPDDNKPSAPYNLYIGQRDGVRPAPPKLLVSGVDGAAAWRAVAPHAAAAPPATTSSSLPTP